MEVTETFQKRVRSILVTEAAKRRAALVGFGEEEPEFRAQGSEVARNRPNPARAPNEIEIVREKVAALSLFETELTSFQIKDTNAQPQGIFGKKVDVLESLFELLEKPDLKPSDLTKPGGKSAARAVTSALGTSLGEREEPTIRITNLAEHVDEGQLHHLVSSVGPVQKVFIPKNELGKSKGFAFVTYRSRESATKAIAKFSRFGFENLIINADWAQPAKARRPQAPVSVASLQ